MCNFIFKDWNNFRFKSQLHIGFSAFNLSVLAAIFITVFVFTFVSTANTETHLRNRLSDTAEGYTRAIASDSARVFDQLLARYARNFLNIIAYSASDFLRTDFPFAPQPTYYEWWQTMKQPTVNDTRYNSEVSFADGGYSVAGHTPFDQATWSQTLNTTISRTEAIMPLQKSLYQTNPEFLGGYYCLAYGVGATTISHLFREYPAASNHNYTQMIRYDCTKDYSFYKPGQDSYYASYGASSRKTVYSGVYIDPWVKNAMITILQPITDPSTGALIGVAGGDLLTTSIQQSINTVKYLARGRSILFEIDVNDPTTGLVIADTIRVAGAQQTKLQSYWQLSSPSISYDLWSQMFQLTVDGTGAQPTFVEIDDYYIASQPLASGNNQYLLCIFVYKDDVTGILQPVISDISTARARAILVNSVVCASVLIIAALVNILLANRIVRPLTELTQDSALLIKQIGHENLAKGIVVRKADSEVSETRALQEAHKKMIETIQQQAQAAAAREAQVHQQINYALPAYSPEGGFDQSMLAQYAAAPADPNAQLPVGVIIGQSASSPPIAASYNGTPSPQAPYPSNGYSNGYGGEGLPTYEQANAGGQMAAASSSAPVYPANHSPQPSASAVAPPHVRITLDPNHSINSPD